MYRASFPQQSNRADWVVSFEVFDADSGEPLDLSGYSFSLGVESEPGQSVLSASTSDGKITVDAANGILSWRIPAASMGSLCPGTYCVGLLMSNGTDTEQVLLGTLPIVRGIPR